MTKRVQAVVVIVLGLLVSGTGVCAASNTDQTSVLVTTTTVRTGSLPHTVSAYGIVQADPSARQAIMAPISASVAKISVRLGEEVPKGAPLIELVPNPQPRADYAKARSALRAADELVKHTKELLSLYLATRQQFVDAEKAQSDARAGLQALKAQGADGPKTLIAPFHATVTKIDASVGMLAAEGAPLLELAPPNSLVLRAGVVPSDASAIKPGDKATIVPVGVDRHLDATVLLRGAVVDPADGLVPVEISLPSNTLFPGQSAEATITTALVDGFVVPHEAILIDNSGHPYVVQVVGQIAKLVPVQVLDADGAKNVVAGALDLKAPLVLSGAYQLQNGMKVRLSNSKVPAK
jgi:RND family efflux transporter MFP subunit